MGVRSSTAASIGGSCRAIVSAKQLASGESTEIVQRAAWIHRLHQRRNHVEHRGQAGVGGEQREERALVLHDDLGALAFGDVGDAGAHQRLLPALQAHQAHFAGNVAAGRVAVNPLEHLRFAGGREPQVLARRDSDGCPSGCISALTASRSDGQQLLARHLEQPQRRLVRLDEMLACPGSMTVIASGALSTSER